MGRGKNFEDLEAAIFDPDAIGEGAAGIDGDAQRRRLLVSRGSQSVLRKLRKRILPEAGKKKVGSNENKQHDRNDAVHGEECRVQLRQVFRGNK